MSARLQRGEAFACVYLDIDSFKPFNDYYGFTRGDTLIHAWPWNGSGVASATAPKIASASGRSN